LGNKDISKLNIQTLIRIKVQIRKRKASLRKDMLTMLGEIMMIQQVAHH